MLRIKLAGFLAAGLICLPAMAQIDEMPIRIESAELVTVTNLPELSYNTMGLQPATRTDMWTPSDAKALLAGLHKLSQATLSAELRKTADFLLQADTTESPLTDPDHQFGSDGFLTARAQTALDLGLFDTAVALADLVPADQQSDALRQVQINALMLSGKTNEACELLDKREMPPYSDKMRISCFLAQEEKNKAILSFAMYSEHPDSDTLFQTLGTAALNELPATLPDDFTVEPHHVYLVSLMKGVPLAVLQKQTAGIRFALADLPTTPVETRIALGERLGLTAEQMARLYKLPLFNLPHSIGALNRADLYQKIKTEINPRTRAVLLSQFFTAAHEDGVFLPLAPLSIALVADMKPDPNDIAIAFDAAALQAVAGNEDEADDWRQILQDSPDTTHHFRAAQLAPLFEKAFGSSTSNREIGVFNDTCNRIKSPACVRFWEQMPSEQQLDKPAFISAIPATDTTAVQALFDAGKIGEGMMALLSALAVSPHYDAPLIRFLTNGAGQWNGHAVATERMLLD